MFPVAWCITMWWMYCTPPKSTRHSVILYPFSDTAHSPPNKGKFDLRPSTARFAE